MRLVIAALMAAVIPSIGWACSADSDCRVGDRVYRIALPEGVANPGVLVFAHGYRGTARGAMRGGNLRRLAAENGMALIAVQAVDGSWQLPGTPRAPHLDGTAEYAYFEAVLTDAAARFGVDRDTAVMTGFSAGGMMTWNLACHRPALFRAFIPMSGTFWDPLPRSCTLPAANVVHIHGNADRTVPLGGRFIGTEKQGDVTEAIGLYTAHGGFGAPIRVSAGDMTCDLRENTDGKVLGFCMFTGGHGFGVGRLRAAMGLVE